MNYIERIQRSVDFIENHLGEELDLNQVARQAYMSLASYYRLFYGFTGYSAKEYIRMRRLHCAAERLASTHDPAVQIALDAGFGSQESFIKAFKAAVGVTPGQYRSRKHIVRYHYERMDLMDKYYAPQDQKLAEAYPEVRVLKGFPPMRIAVVSFFNEHPEEDGYAAATAFASKHGLLGPEKGSRLLGVDLPAWMGIAHGYEFWVTLPAGFEEVEEDGIDYKDFPGGDYVIVSTTFEHLFEAKERAALFIRQSPFGFSFAPHMEEHIPHGDDTRGEFHLDLYFPISLDPSNKEPVEAELPPMRAAALPLTDGKQFEQAWRAYEKMILSGASQADCKLYIMQTGLNKMLTGSIELWISLPEGAAAPEGWARRTFGGGRHLRFDVQIASGYSEVVHCYEISTQKGYKHSNNQLLMQYPDYNVPWDEKMKQTLYYPVKASERDT